MNGSMLQIVSLALLLLGIGFVMIRLFIGPSAADRLVAADTLGVITTAALVGLAAWLDSPLYLDVALVYGVLAFVGSIALARALEGDAE